VQLSYVNNDFTTSFDILKGYWVSIVARPVMSSTSGVLERKWLEEMLMFR